MANFGGVQLRVILRSRRGLRVRQARRERIGRFGIYEDFGHGVEAWVSRAALKMPFCGQTQQPTWWNKDCNTVLHGLGINANRVGESAFDIASGLQYRTMSMPESYGHGERCDLREPRKFSGTCPDGFCATNGVCVAARCSGTTCGDTLPAVTYFDVDHTPSPPPSGGFRASKKPAEKR